MDQAQKLAVFRAQVTNTRALSGAIRQVRRSINLALRRNDLASVVAFTKIYSVLFCAWAEANFSKVVHTPYGFSVDEIQQINSEKSKGIAEGWRKAVQFGIGHRRASQGNFAPNAHLRLERAIDRYVFDQSVLRNKLAHGQWVVALNRENNTPNPQLTKLIADLDRTRIDGWRSCHEGLARMVETLIESPERTFVRDWWSAVVKLDADMEEAARRTLECHILALKAKDARTGAHVKRHTA